MSIAPLRNGLVAAAVFAALPASAGVTTLPGTMCTSDGPVAKGLTGLMTNTSTKLGPNQTATTTDFYCPIIHSQLLYASGSSVRVTVNAKISNSTAPFVCKLRSVKPGNVTFDQVDIPIPGSYPSGLSYRTVTSVYLSMPGADNIPVALASVNMRCEVPNVISGVEAGIVSYIVEW